MRVYIIGAGPGDPKLLTLRGAELIAACPVVLYTGSLVPREVLATARPDAKVIDSSGLTLDQILEVIVAARDADEDVARVHTGDPVIFGSTAEQMRRLDALGIDYDVTPGVPAFAAAAALLKTELTLPEVSQTIIITRTEGICRYGAYEIHPILTVVGLTQLNAGEFSHGVRLVAGLQGPCK